MEGAETCKRPLRSVRQFVADLAFDNLPQRRILGRQLLQRLNERAVPALQLLHAARDHVDQDVWIVDRFERFFDLIVSYGGGGMRRKTGNCKGRPRGRQ